MIDFNLLGATIRKKRIERGWKIAELAFRAGISEDFLGKIERATDTPSLQTVASIANALQLGIDYLLGPDIDNVDGMLCNEINDMLERMNPKQKKLFLIFLRNNQPFFEDLHLDMQEYGD